MLLWTLFAAFGELFEAGARSDSPGEPAMNCACPSDIIRKAKVILDLWDTWGIDLLNSPGSANGEFEDLREEIELFCSPLAEKE
jgi:hypothetical protein